MVPGRSILTGLFVLALARMLYAAWTGQAHLITVLAVVACVLTLLALRRPATRWIIVAGLLTAIWLTVAGAALIVVGIFGLLLPAVGWPEGLGWGILQSAIGVWLFRTLRTGSDRVGGNKEDDVAVY